MWLIMSDSHDNLPKIKKAVELAKEKKCSLILHLGDIVSPFVAPIIFESGIEFQGVFGNNDGELLFLSQKFKNIRKGPYHFIKDEINVFMMHEPFSLEPAVKSQLYDLVLFGHTHEIILKKEGKTLVINPGETCGYLTGKSTVVLFEPKTKEYELVEI